MNARPAVLVIAATDSSGGAGLSRDVRVLSEFGVDVLCAVTAVTAQSDQKVTAVHHIPPEVVRAQISAAFETRRVDAIKIGMLGTQATVEAVAEALAGRVEAPLGRGAVRPGRVPLDQAQSGQLSDQVPSSRASSGRHIPLVIDPVLVSSSGGVLLDDGGRAALIRTLFPLATLVTPNVPEVAALLTERVASDEATLIEQGKRLLDLGSAAILLKGGHREGDEAVDLLISQAGVEKLVSARLAGSSRGTGCALASAIAAGLAGGEQLSVACAAAKRYVLGMLAPGR